MIPTTVSILVTICVSVITVFCVKFLITATRTLDCVSCLINQSQRELENVRVDLNSAQSIIMPTIHEVRETMAVVRNLDVTGKHHANEVARFMLAVGETAKGLQAVNQTVQTLSDTFSSSVVGSGLSMLLSRKRARPSLRPRFSNYPKQR
jgi:hypothetical protein